MIYIKEIALKRSYIVNVLSGKDTDKEVLVKGWVRTRRDSKGGFSFIALNDGSCFNNLQIIVDGDLENYQTEIVRLHPGSSIAVRGTLVKSQGGGQSVEVKAEEVKVYGHCDPEEYVIGKQRISLNACERLPISGSGPTHSEQLPASVISWLKLPMISFRSVVFFISILQS